MRQNWQCHCRMGWERKPSAGCVILRYARLLLSTDWNCLMRRFDLQYFSHISTIATALVAVLALVIAVIAAFIPFHKTLKVAVVKTGDDMV